MLTVENVDLFYGAAQALKSVSMQAETGKVTCVMGRNGVGKTSLMRAVVGQQPAGVTGFVTPGIGEIDVDPASEAVGAVPLRLQRCQNVIIV